MSVEDYPQSHGSLAGLSDTDHHVQYATDVQGTLAARPGPGRAGRLYFATDTGAYFRDTGTTWVELITAAGGTITGNLTVGDADTDLLLQRALLVETHARSTTLAYTGTDLTSVVEKVGATTVRTTTLTYTAGNLTQTVETAGGKTITTTLTYTGSDLTSTTRTVA